MPTTMKKIKNGDVLSLVDAGVLSITNHNVSIDHAYKVFKFRKSVENIVKSIHETEIALIKEAGVEDASMFDKVLTDLRQRRDEGKITDEEMKILAEHEETLVRYRTMRDSLLNEETEIDCLPLPYQEWYKLQNENSANEINGTKVDVLVGGVEMLLEGILWTE